VTLYGESFSLAYDALKVHRNDLLEQQSSVNFNMIEIKDT